MRSFALLSGAGIATVVSVAAFAVWSTTGAGVAEADTSTLGAASSVTASASVSTVTLTWTPAVPPSGASLTGYYVTRWAGSTPADACGTTPSVVGSYVSGAATGCSDTSVPNGSYTYTVTAVFATWTAESLSSNAIVVNADGTAPTLSLAATGASNAYLSGSTLFYRPTVAGSVQFALTVSDGQSGPASATFPAIATPGWTHAAETVTTGTGAAPSITYTSSPFSWTPSPSNPASKNLVGTDGNNNNSTIPVSFATDVSAPTAGALTVNSAVASGAGSSSVNRTGAFAINSRVDYTSDTGSGVASSVLTRQAATLTNGVCGTYGVGTVLVGAPAQSALTTGCYRFTLTGTDRVGNAATVSTTVLVDLVAPTQTFSLVSPLGASVSGSRIYFRGTAAGSFSVATAVTDAESGPASATFPVIGTTGWTHNAETVSVGTGSAPTVTYTSTAYSWTAVPSIPASKNFVATDLAGNTVTTAVAFTRDNTAPAGGALRVNATNASAAGTTSNNGTGAFVINTRTDYTEAQSTTAAGLAASVLLRQFAPLSAATCGTFDAGTVLVGLPAQSGLATGCYKFTLTGTDNVGNTAAVTTTVRVDTSAPVGAVLTVNGTTATNGSTTSSNGTGAWAIDVRTDWTDPEWAATTSTLTRSTATITAGACGAFGANTTIVGTPAQTGVARTCYRYVLTGTNTAGLVSTVTTIVKVDPYVTGVQLLNGAGVAGQADAGDTITVTFSDVLDTSTMCSVWSGTGNQSITGDNQLTVSLNNAGTDTLTMTSSLCTLNVGTFSLGSNAYTAATRTFGGAGANKSTLTWNAATKTLTVVLGARSGAVSAPVASSIVTYTPSTALKNGGGLSMGGTFATANLQQF